MLPPDYRLPVGQHHQPLYSFRTPYFTAKVFTTTLSHPRFGFIVSKKTAPEAVKRNRMKRRLRAVIEHQLPQIQPGYDILFILQREAGTASPEELEASVRTFAEKKQLYL